MYSINLITYIMVDMIGDSYSDILIDMWATAIEDEQ